jgi:hypothetical protein
MKTMLVTTKHEKGDRVYYADDGPEVKGTIVNVFPKYRTSSTGEYFEVVYTVRWDDDKENGDFSSNQLIPL